MFFLIYSFQIASFAILLIIFILARNYFVRRELKIAEPIFSTKNYYIFMSPYIFGVLGLCLITWDWSYLIIFVAFMITGVIGETIFSFFWDILFAKRFWIYKTKTLFKSYTSLLNFVPWGIGGLLYLMVIKIFPVKNVQELNFSNPLINFWLIYGSIFTIIIIERLTNYLIKREKTFLEFKEVNIKNYLVFTAPVVIGMIIVTLLVSWKFVFIVVIMGLMAFFAEYAFGKSCAVFLGRRLWTYTYFSYDEKHITPLAIIPFVLAGIYFWTIFEIVDKLVL